MSIIKDFLKERRLYYFLLLLCILFTGSVFFCFGSDLLDSDISSEMVLGRLLRQEGSFLSENWYYSTELRVMSISLAYKLFFYIFDSWHLVHVFGMSLGLLLLAGSYCFFAERMELGKTGLLCGLILLLPFSVEYARFVMWGGYYLPHLIFLLLTLGLAAPCRSLRFAKVFLTVNCIIAFLTGFGGFRYALILYVPLAATVLGIIIYYLFRDKGYLDDGLKAKFIHYGRVSVWLLLANVAGIAVNSLILKNIYTFKSYEEQCLSDFVPSMICDFALRSFNTNFGYTGCSSFISWEGFRALCALFFCVLCFSLICLACLKFAKFRFEHKFLILFGLIGFALNVSFCSLAILLSVRFIVVSQMVFIPIAAISLDYLKNYGFKAVRNLIIAAAVSCISVQLIAFCVNPNLDYYINSKIRGMIPAYSAFPMKNNLISPSGVKQAIEYLLANGYRNGYATFWHSNIITELSDGKLEMWTLKSGYDKAGSNWFLMIYRPWLQDRRHLENEPDGKVFLLLTDAEKSLDKSGLYTDEKHLVYSVDDIKVYGFNNYEAMYAGLLNRNLNKMVSIKRNGENAKNNGKATAVLPPGSKLTSPEFTVLEGRYKLLVKDASAGEVKKISGEIKVKDGSQKKRSVKFKLHEGLNDIPFRIKEEKGHFSISIKNSSGKTCKIKRIELVEA